MQYIGMFLMTVITGFLLVATFGLVATVQARKAKPLLHHEVALISVRHFRKTGPFSESKICIAKEALLLGRVSWMGRNTTGYTGRFLVSNGNEGNLPVTTPFRFRSQAFVPVILLFPVQVREFPKTELDKAPAFYSMNREMSSMQMSLPSVLRILSALPRQLNCCFGGSRSIIFRIQSGLLN